MQLVEKHIINKNHKLYSECDSLSLPEINPETIASKFNVDVRTVKYIISKNIHDYE